MSQSAELLDDVRAQLAANRTVRRRLKPRGLLRIERQLPFLFVYRSHPGGNDAGVASLIRGEASYLVAPGDRQQQAAVHECVRTVGATLSPLFEAFLVVEIWTGPHATAGGDRSGQPGGPGFRIFCRAGFETHSTIYQLRTALGRIHLSKRRADVSVATSDAVAPPGLPPLLTADEAQMLRLELVGLEIRPVFQDAQTGDLLPIARAQLQRQLARVFREAAFEFSRRETSFRPPHYQALGRRAFVKAVWEADAALAAISRQFDLLLTVTPINTQAAFREFESRGYGRDPVFYYPPSPINPPLLKRALYAIPLERIHDPTLAFLFEEKRRELDLKLTLVEERETRRFLPSSMALYGNVDGGLVDEAVGLLAAFPPPPPRNDTHTVDAAEFAARAETLFAELRASLPELDSRVQLRPELTSLTVSDGNLLVGSQMNFPAERVEALLQHEVGTHIVTHWNGTAQPFQLLAAGLAGYDELQEGLAVFVEYLVGGLNRVRLRILAARVVAARARVEGASFVETFRTLQSSHGFSAHAAFLNTMRVYRAGGFVKDAVYLRGLRSVLSFVKNGGDLELLLVGKVATEHAPIIEELQRREVLKPIAIRPRYLDDPANRLRLERARKGLSLVQLLD